MRVNLNTNINHAKPNFKAHFADDKETKEIIDITLTWNPERTLVTDYILKNNIKADDSISIKAHNGRGYDTIFEMCNNRTGDTYRFRYNFNSYKHGKSPTPIDGIFKGIKEGKITDDKNFNIDDNTEKAYYDKAKKFVAKLAPKEDKEIAKLEQKIQKLETQLKTLKENLRLLDDRRFDIVAEGVKKEIYKVVKK